MMSWLNRRNPSSVLGLSLEGSRVEGVVMRRGAGTLEVQRSFNAALSLDPLTNDPELVGREIRNHLNAASVRERRCVVSIPLKWALTLQTKVPELSEEDVGSFLNVQAEKGFPYAPEDLSISVSRYRSRNGEQHATLVAIPKNHLTLLEKALKAAQLKPTSFTLGIAGLRNRNEDASVGTLSLAIGEQSVDLQVTSGGGVVALRALEGAFETAGSERHIDADLIAREIKITLGQLPREIRETVTQFRVFGRADLAQPLAKEIRSRVAGMGLNVEVAQLRPPNGFAVPLPADKGSSPTLNMAVRAVTAVPAEFEFLPPKVSTWSQFSHRVSNRKFLWASATAGAAVVLVSGAFLWQHWKLSDVDKKWRSIEAKVRNAEDLQQKIRFYRPWFDDSMRSLTILKKLTEAFPEDGAVVAKTLEIRDLSLVSCTGEAQDYPAFEKMMNQLRATKEVSELKKDQIQGKPLRFTFNFRWNEGGAGEN